MKKVTLLFLTVLFVNHYTFGQTKEYPQLDFVNQVFFIDTLTKKIEKLEVIKPLKTATKGAMFSPSMKFVYLVQGDQSPVRITSINRNFIIRTKDDSIDPSTFITLYKCIKTRKNREAELSKISTMTANAKAINSTIKITFKKVANNTFIILTNEVLAKGEYFFLENSNEPNVMSYAFGID